MARTKTPPVPSDAKLPSTSGRVASIEAVKTPLGYFTLACLIVEVVFGGLVLKLSGEAQLIALWGLIGTLVLLILVVALIAYFRPESLGTAIGAGSRAIHSELAGEWWELILNHPNIAVGHVALTFGAGGPKLEGTSYNQEGVPVADWSSDAAALSTTKRELFYFWRGDESSSEFKDFSGLALFRFKEAENGQGKRGRGWFTSGSLSELTTEMFRKVELRRLTPQEERRYATPGQDAATALAAYTEWRKQASPVAASEAAPQPAGSGKG